MEALVQSLIDLLDHMDGDCDLEDSDQDRCAARDDDLNDIDDAWFHGPGDPEDAEDDGEDRCMAGDDGCGPFLLQGRMHYGSDWDEDVLIGSYGIDQTKDAEISMPNDGRSLRQPHIDRIRHARCVPMHGGRWQLRD